VVMVVVEIRRGRDYEFAGLKPVRPATGSTGVSRARRPRLIVVVFENRDRRVANMSLFARRGHRLAGLATILPKRLLYSPRLPLPGVTGEGAIDLTLVRVRGGATALRRTPPPFLWGDMKRLSFALTWREIPHPHHRKATPSPVSSNGIPLKRINHGLKAGRKPI
jgi:hypothetical protein